MVVRKSSLTIRIRARLSARKAMRGKRQGSASRCTVRFSDDTALRRASGKRAKQEDYPLQDANSMRWTARLERRGRVRHLRQRPAKRRRELRNDPTGISSRIERQNRQSWASQVLPFRGCRLRQVRRRLVGEKILHTITSGKILFQPSRNSAQTYTEMWREARRAGFARSYSYPHYPPDSS